ncbi:DsbA family protein [Nocardiopsis xinjiangensis]|uniref:DsbA family protein n=1 Tax=Nocardiopsis xinjiangensis TaxID=124285 RepID=UPI000347A952|nr:thioredoxin domain-containing protein [Nocardiopsis xinjiangensis]
MPQQKKQDGTQSSGALWPLLASAVLVLVVVVGLIAWAADSEDTSDDGTATDTSAAGQQDEAYEEARAFGETLARRDGEDPAALGEEDAPIVLIGYSDYQCPYCARWVEEVQPELVERYVEPGDLRIEWREFPYMGETSHMLSVGAHAAGEQGAYWDYHEAVYGAQETFKDEDPETLADLLTGVAEDQGLDAERFADDLAEDDLNAAVDGDFAEGQRLGVSGTPAFIINGTPVFGAQPLDVFTDAIDTALEQEG